MARLTVLARTAARLLRTPQGKRTASTALGHAESVAQRVTGGSHAARIAKARAAAQRSIDRL